MAPEPRIHGDRTVYYNMKASRPGPVTSKTATTPGGSTSTPLGSPRGPFSVGQNYPPKLSPRHNLLSTPVGHLGAQGARTPSPNYFGLHVESNAGDLRESSHMPRENWSPPSSSIKSFAAAIPKQLPLDANPDFEAFKRQADANRGGSAFSLGTSHFGINSPALHAGASSRPLPPTRWHTHGSETSRPDVTVALPVPTLKPSNDAILAGQMDIDATDSNSMYDSAYVSADSKRNSESSMNPPSFFNQPRYESPAHLESPFDKKDGLLDNKRSGLSKIDDRHPRLSLVHGKADPPSPGPMLLQKNRSDTVPIKLETGSPGMMPVSQLKDLLDASPQPPILLLDLRVSPQYAQSRIKGALNLCIPTTLLKRATFNLQKLQQTFQADTDQKRFAKWRETVHLVVYDAYSSEKRDAVSAMNTIKKFSNEGYTGTCSILRGGFNAFSAAYPALVEHGSTGEHASGGPALSLSAGAGGSDDKGRPSVAPVIGGVMLPNMSNASNPFFANIRQNQDLVDGVGQMDVSVPQGTEMEALPRWLREAADKADHGKKVSDKFLKIELIEQARMKGAYSVFTPASVPNNEGSTKPEKVQLCGIEKGSKNRYKNILPFEHARVKLQGKPDEACDYVNASYIKAPRSHKRYIASQGPLPATFEDFWSVVWDQDVRVIVMLTAEAEGGQLKCHTYWKDREFGPIKLRALSEKKVSLEIDKHRSQSTVPASGASDVNGSGSVSTAVPHNDDPFSFGGATSVSEMSRKRANTTTTLLDPGSATPSKPATTAETPYVIIRKFALSHASHPFAPIREITHLHYTSWPDFGAPAQPSHVLALVELANVMQRAALPIDVPGTLARSPHQSESASKSTSSNVRRHQRTSNNMPVTWHDEPESDQSTRPMLVHCSAGCGRTGTFCTVDSVIDMLKRQRMRNIRKANANIERRMANSHTLIPPSQAPSRDVDGDVSMGGQSSFYSARPRDANPFDDAISPGTSIPPVSFPDLTVSLDSKESKELDIDKEDPDVDTSWIDDDAIDLIATTVGDFRGQRLSMVQTLRQFVLCYETVIEWVWRLQERGGPAGSAVGAPGTGVGGTAAMRARGRSGTVAGAFLQ